MKHYLKLTRPLNLLIICFTMVGVRHYLMVTNGETYFWEWSFALLVLSMVLIAGAGNVINDYFDVETDRINKPEKLIVGKYITPKQALRYYIALNSTAVLIALFLCWHLETWVFAVFHPLLVLLLYLYSYYFKKTLLMGNFFVSCIVTSAVIVVPLFMDADKIHYSYPHDTLDPVFQTFNWNVVWGFALLAFLQNLAREIIKDVEDMAGDKKINATTFPIVYGEKFAIEFFGIVTLIYPLLLCYYFFAHSLHISVYLIPLIISAFINIFVGYLAFFDKSPKAKRWMKNFTKYAMIIGLLYLFLPR